MKSKFELDKDVCNESFFDIQLVYKSLIVWLSSYQGPVTYLNVSFSLV